MVKAVNCAAGRGGLRLEEEVVRRRRGPLGCWRARPLLLVTLAAVVSLTGATTAAGTDPLPAPQTLSPAMTVAREVRLAMDRDGNAVAVFFYGDDRVGGIAYCKIVWEETNDCTAAARSWPADGGLSPQVDLSARFSARNGEGDVVMDGHGGALAVWAGTAQWGGVGGIVARARSADGTWGAPQVLSPDPLSPAVAMDDQGRAVVTWLHPIPSFPLLHDEVQARGRAADGTLTPVQDVSTTGVQAWGPQVAVNAAGDAVLVWQAQLDGQTWTVQARGRAADGTLSPVQNLSAPGVNSVNPRVRLDADGDALVVWQLGLVDGVQARVRAADGTLSAVQAISPAGRRGSDPQLAMLDDGRAMVVWSGAEPNGFDTRVRARARAATGAWSPVETVSLPASLSIVDGPQVAMDQSGRAIVVWTQEAGDTILEPVQARTRSPLGAWSSVRNLSAARAVTWQPKVAVSPAGRAVVAWEEYWSFSDHHDWGAAMMGRAFQLSSLPPDLTPPNTTIVSGPPAITTKRNVAFGFRSNEPGSTFRCRLDSAVWRGCSSPRRYSALPYGRHVFRVRAIDPSGNVDPTPAVRVFKVVRP